MAPVSAESLITIPGAEIVQLSFYVLLGMYALYTAAFYYHWKTYSSDVRVEFLTLVAYFAITIPLLITMSAVVLIS
jgi:hypothetical protein